VTTYQPPESIEAARCRRENLLRRSRAIEAALCRKDVRKGDRVLTASEYQDWRRAKLAESREVEGELAFLREWIKREERDAHSLLRRCEAALSDLLHEGALDGHQQALLADVHTFLFPKRGAAGVVTTTNTGESHA